MLLKLIKFKMRAAKKPFLLISLFVLIFTVVIAVSGNIMASALQNQGSTTILDISFTMATPLLGFSTMGLAFTLFAGYAIISYSVYQTYGKSSAYLYFTLPASRKMIYLSSALSVVIGSVALFLLGILAVLVIAVSYWLNPDVHSLAELIGNILDSIFMFSSIDAPSASVQILDIITSVLSVVSSLMWTAVYINASCIFGCSIAKKHTLLGSIIAGCIITWIASFALSIITIILSLSLGSGDVFGENYDTADYIISFAEYAYYIAISIALHFISVNRLEKKFDIIV